MEKTNNQKNYGKGISYKGADGLEYTTREQLFEADNRYFESIKINDSSKIKYPDVQPKLNFELKTEPVKDTDGRIIEPAIYLDAQTPKTFETQLMQAWNALTPTQKKAFIQIMAEQAEKNKQSEETPKKGK